MNRDEVAMMMAVHANPSDPLAWLALADARAEAGHDASVARFVGLLFNGVLPSEREYPLHHWESDLLGCSGIATMHGLAYVLRQGVGVLRICEQPGPRNSALASWRREDGATWACGNNSEWEWWRTWIATRLNTDRAPSIVSPAGGFWSTAHAWQQIRGGFIAPPEYGQLLCIHRSGTEPRLCDRWYEMREGVWTIVDVGADEIA